MDYNFVRQRLKEVLEQAGMSVRQASMRAGMGDQRLRNFLFGRSQKIKAPDLQNVLKALRFTEAEFFKQSPATAINPSNPMQIYDIPIYGEIPAGHPTWTDGAVTPID